MNRHQRRAAAKGKFAIVPDLSLTQIKLTKDGAPDKNLTFAPSGLRDFFTVCLLEQAHRQPIDDVVFETLARQLGTEPGERFRREICEAVIGVVLMVVYGYYSPRRLKELFVELRRDPLTTIAKSRGDQFAEFVFNTIQQQVAQTGLSEKAVLDYNIDAMREVVPVGHPDEEARTIYLETIINMAQKYKLSLMLPSRDDSRGPNTSPLFEFATAMLNLLVDYARTMLARKQLPTNRFDSFASIKRKHLIKLLAAARDTLAREKPMISRPDPTIR